MSYSVREEELNSIREEWEAILPSCSSNTIFVTPGWQDVWWRNFGEDSQLCILTIRNADALLGIAPLMVKDGVASFVGDKDLFDYFDFLVPLATEETFYEALCDYLLNLDWHTLELSSLPQESPTLRYLPAVADMLGVGAEVTREEMTPVASLPASWDEYLGGLTKKNRHELRRKLRRLEKTDNHRQYSIDDLDGLTDGMGDFFRLMRASSHEKDEFLTPEREQFFLDVAFELAPKDRFKLYFLEVSGVRVASCICFDYDDSYLLYNSGYDPNYSDLSVGLLNKALCIRAAIEEGRHSFNFLKGTERYKYDLGGTDKAVYDLVVRR